MGGQGGPWGDTGPLVGCGVPESSVADPALWRQGGCNYCGARVNGNSLAFAILGSMPSIAYLPVGKDVIAAMLLTLRANAINTAPLIPGGTLHTLGGIQLLLFLLCICTVSVCKGKHALTAL